MTSTQGKCCEEADARAAKEAMRAKLEPDFLANVRVVHPANEASEAVYTALPLDLQR